jgi:GNAT superfamily N-acetyltransferase
MGTFAMIEIREAEAADADAMCEAHVMGWRVGYRGIVPDWFLDSPEVEAERRTNWRDERWRQSADSTMFVAALDRRVVGFAHVGPERTDDEPTGRGEVYSFYLHPDAWGTGIASELMAVCETKLRAAGFTEAVLWCLRDNPRGRAFYEKAGWVFTGEESTWHARQTSDGQTLQPVADVKYERRL